MSLHLLHYPHPLLREKAKPVTDFSEAFRAKVQMMFDLLYEKDQHALAIAATQVGWLVRLFVADLSSQQDTPLCLINPEISTQSGTVESEEGCLSIPGIYITIPRAECITVNYQDPFGEPKTLQADGLLARCIQHEIEHLDGILMIDKLSNLKKSRIVKKYQKQQKLAG